MSEGAAMKPLRDVIAMGLAPFLVVLLAAAGVPLIVTLVLVVMPAFLWTMSALDSYPRR
jgi:hypothetical protein